MEWDERFTIVFLEMLGMNFIQINQNGELSWSPEKPCSIYREIDYTILVSLPFIMKNVWYRLVLVWKIFQVLVMTKKKRISTKMLQYNTADWFRPFLESVLILLDCTWKYYWQLKGFLKMNISLVEQFIYQGASYFSYSLRDVVEQWKTAQRKFSYIL